MQPQTTVPKITVITPSFNQGQYLEATILSVLSQKYANLEYFVIDGGSTDNSVDIIRSYESQIDFWVSEKDKGQSEAINKGLQKATGNIITWLNSDDQFTAGTLQKVADYFTNNPQNWVVHGKTRLFGRGMKDQIKGCPIVNNLKPYYFAALPFPQPSAFFRREAVQEYGLLTADYHYGMDYDFFVRIALNHHFLAVDDVFSNYLLHPESKSVALSSRFAKDYARIFGKVLRSFPQAHTLIEKLIEADLYEKGNDSYQVSKDNLEQVTENLLKEALLLNLKYQITFYYEDFTMNEIRKICKFIATLDKPFFEQDQELKTIYQRSNLHPYILKGLRELKKII
jgi:glycosyltransferase involved in cell wall biosynthesis